jgi:hypothetical protein
MRHPLLRLAAPLLLTTALLSSAAVVGCASTQATPQQRRENLAWSAEDTRNFARFVGEFVRNREGASADNPALLARAEILRQHAEDQSRRVAAYQVACETGAPQGSEATLDDLQRRNEGLRRERAALNHEWDVWQVQIGVKKAEDTELSYVPATPDNC